MKSLAYRIATMNCDYPFPEILINKQALQCRDYGKRALIRKVQKIDASNVAEFYAQHERAIWNFGNDIPNFAPPFEHCFVEHTEPKNWLIDGKHVVVENPGQIGSHILSFDFQKFPKLKDEESVKMLFAEICGAPRPLELTSALAAKLPASRWIIFVDFWTAMHSSGRKPHWLGVQAVILVSAKGIASPPTFFGVSLNHINENKMWPPIHDMLISALHILGLTFSFMHCKNVVRSVRAEDVPPRLVKHQNMPPRIKHYVLNINPMKEVLRTEGRSDEVGIKKALHICHGHFATYSEEKPLFGRIAGTFWIPDHVRGTIERGEVIKDYNVNPKDDL